MAQISPRITNALALTRRLAKLMTHTGGEMYNNGKRNMNYTQQDYIGHSKVSMTHVASIYSLIREWNLVSDMGGAHTRAESVALRAE